MRSSVVGGGVAQQNSAQQNSAQRNSAQQESVQQDLARTGLLRGAAALGVVTCTTAGLVLASAPLALADTAAESRISGSLSGPVGLATVALGAGGLVLGFLRRRKAVVSVSVQNQRIALPAEDVLPTSVTPPASTRV
ncbi:hypothetical protein [Umezawaea beigongshangensis]|uniref:hypothetical protein n=1 Tax=Umezawaea beigongshangensis TaxID=2780383 RepID=UPI0018F10BFA|nr:hypothetical protein [Umezawaea beigongshangensis]